MELFVTHIQIFITLLQKVTSKELGSFKLFRFIVFIPHKAKGKRRFELTRIFTQTNRLLRFFCTHTILNRFVIYTVLGLTNLLQQIYHS